MFGTFLLGKEQSPTHGYFHVQRFRIIVFRDFHGCIWVHDYVSSKFAEPAIIPHQSDSYARTLIVGFAINIFYTCMHTQKMIPIRTNGQTKD